MRVGAPGGRGRRNRLSGLCRAKRACVGMILQSRLLAIIIPFYAGVCSYIFWTVGSGVGKRVEGQYTALEMFEAVLFRAWAGRGGDTPTCVFGFGGLTRDSGRVCS